MSPVWWLFYCRQSQLSLVPVFDLFLLTEVHDNFNLLSFSLLTTVYCKTTHLFTRGDISPRASLGDDFTRMSHCLKVDLLSLTSSLRFYDSGGLFPTKKYCSYSYWHWTLGSLSTIYLRAGADPELFSEKNLGPVWGYSLNSPQACILVGLLNLWARMSNTIFALLAVKAQTSALNQQYGVSVLQVLVGGQNPEFFAT